MMIEIDDIPETLATIQSEPLIRVDIEWIGEGFDGDYDPDWPDDYPHARFTVFMGDGQVENASFCTRLDARSDQTILDKAAKLVLREFEDSYPNHKRMMEHLSWMAAEDFEDD